jgi:hypothetical protein
VNKHFTKREPKMTNKNLKIFPTLLFIREILFKITDSTTQPVKELKLKKKKPDHVNIGREFGSC